MPDIPDVMKASAKVAAAQIRVSRTRQNLAIAMSKLEQIKTKAATSVKQAEEVVAMFRNELSTDMLNHNEALGAMQQAGQLPQQVP